MPRLSYGAPPFQGAPKFPTFQSLQTQHHKFSKIKRGNQLYIWKPSIISMHPFWKLVAGGPSFFTLKIMTFCMATPPQGYRFFQRFVSIPGGKIRVTWPSSCHATRDPHDKRQKHSTVHFYRANDGLTWIYISRASFLCTHYWNWSRTERVVWITSLRAPGTSITCTSPPKTGTEGQQNLTLSETRSLASLKSRPNGGMSMASSSGSIFYSSSALFKTCSVFNSEPFRLLLLPEVPDMEGAFGRSPLIE